jgi:hypothetical protein
MSTQLQAAGLLGFIADLNETIDAGALALAFDIEELASQLAPEDTGDLKASGDVRDGDRPGTYEVRFGDGLPDERAAAQEFGTVYSDAQPYIQPAIDTLDPLFRMREELARLARQSRV